jgi:mitochondrial import inner membrane translocase subunit TIM50
LADGCPAIGIYKPADVRPILKAYEGKDIPREYALKEAAEKRALIEEWKAHGGGKGLSSGGFTLSSLFSGKDHVCLLAIFFSSLLRHLCLKRCVCIQSPTTPETYLEKQRREAQAFYLSEQKYLNDNKAEIERLMQEDMQARAKEMGGTVFGMLAGFTGKPQEPPASETGTGPANTEGQKANV